MANARDLRLEADYAGLLALAKGSGGTLVIDSMKGRPPDEYLLTFRCRSIERLRDSKPVYRHFHRVQIRLPARYPAPVAPPQVRMLTPIFHPHVFPNLEVCMGSWQTSEYLEDFVLRLGALIQYDRSYMNVRDPANEEAVDWARKNLLLLPTDTCTFRGDNPARARSNAEEALMPLPDIAAPLQPQPAEEEVPMLWIELTDP